ncbi:importin subunit beta-1-like [Clytia hemisphaerica]|uniref:Importin N-terminal domain-containing protein n=1 Tax=Clytia hemisphaerica TaxID=252671 RepID=A0A7M5V190_9CNID
MEELKRVLQGTVSPDQNELQAALKYLEDAATHNFPQFVDCLSSLLSNASEPSEVRQAAGIQLKNCLVAKSASLKQGYHERWFNLEEQIRNKVKAQVLQSLGTETTKPSSAASCVSGIASAELPLNLWPELMQQLCEVASAPGSSETLKEASLEAIGYICQDLDHQFLTQHSAAILRTIMTGLAKEQPNNNIKFAAANAFLNSLEFIRGNFEKQDDRNFMMTVLCNATVCPEKRIKVASLQCCVKIMSLYYEYMGPYMQSLFNITVDAMKSDDEDVVLQGVEFWSSVCDEEIDLAIEAADATEMSQEIKSFSQYYAKNALQHIVPIVVDILTRQEEHDDEEDWTPHKAAGVCLMLLASCCGNDIVDHVLPFVKENIQKTDWKLRDASVMAFGSILEGPDPEKISPPVKEGIGLLIALMEDPNMTVRDSVAWTLTRICEQIPEAALNTNHIENFLNALIKNLDSEPRVANNVCWAFSALADAAYDSAQCGDDESEPKTYILSSKFPFIISKIIATGDRGDAHLSNLRSSAYEAVMDLVKNSPKDVYEAIGQTFEAILGKMVTILKMEEQGNQVGDYSQHNDFKSLLCATLQATLRKLTPEDVMKASKQCMEALLRMLTVSKVGGVQEDAFMAVGTMVECLGNNFMGYLEAFKPFLIQGLQNRAEYSVCISAIGVVGDLCRAVGAEITPYCDEIMQSCLENLADNSVHRSVKPHVLSTFGDIALAIGKNFSKYAEIVLTTLVQASGAQVDKSDYDLVDYLNELREHCLEAYTGIIQGLKGEDDKNINPEVQIVTPQLFAIFQFIEVISQDPDRTDALVGACCGLLGDICTAFELPQNLKDALSSSVISELLSEGRRSKESKTRTLSVWASKTIRNMRR